MRVEERLLVSPKDLRPCFGKWSVAGVFNPAGARLSNGKIVLVARVAEMPPKAKGKGFFCPMIAKADCYKARADFVPGKAVAKRWPNGITLKNRASRLLTLSHFRKIVLAKNGFDVESVSQKPFFTGTCIEGQYGIEDPRITRLGKEYAMTYVAVSVGEGISTCLALSKDLRNWRRQGIIFRQQNKDVAIFPEKINGRFVALHRPEGSMGFGEPSIWVSYSKDLAYWGKDRAIVFPREKSWDSFKVGAGTVPLKTKEGWLCFYHGVKRVREKNFYSAGALLLDLKNPEKVLARSPVGKPLLSPKKAFEKKGFVNNVVFPTVALPDLDERKLLVYCGGADKVISVKKITLEAILNSMQFC